MTDHIVTDDDAERIAALLRSGPSDKDDLFGMVQKDFPNINKVSLGRMLDEWFKKYRLATHDSEFDVIYVNGSNNLPNLRQDDEHWKVRLIEEAFHQQMWDVEA